MARLDTSHLLILSSEIEALALHLPGGDIDSRCSMPSLSIERIGKKMLAAMVWIVFLLQEPVTQRCRCIQYDRRPYQHTAPHMHTSCCLLFFLETQPPICPHLDVLGEIKKNKTHSNGALPDCYNDHHQNNKNIQQRVFASGHPPNY